MTDRYHYQAERKIWDEDAERPGFVTVCCQDFVGMDQTFPTGIKKTICIPVEYRLLIHEELEKEFRALIRHVKRNIARAAKMPEGWQDESLQTGIKIMMERR